MSENTNFIRNLEYGNTRLMMEKARARVIERYGEFSSVTDIWQAMAEEYARLMEVPESMFDDFVASIVRGFYRELQETRPDDPLLDTDAGRAALEEVGNE